ncbi:hypothetical protein [Nocardia sp. NPDC127526]|uniref:hypothetical protein n=1 Tax=Nocardia sp. NPDC127526 TaxID=3345393 RepID=UPI00363DF5AC
MATFCFPADQNLPADPAPESWIVCLARHGQITAGGTMATSVLTHMVVELPTVTVASNWALFGGAVVYTAATSVRIVRAVWTSGFSGEIRVKFSKTPRGGSGRGKHHR